MASFRVATYNLHHGAPPGRRLDVSGLKRSVSQLGAQILALQEVDRRVVRTRFVDLARISARAAGLHPTFAKARSLGPLGEYGIALLTPEPPTAVEFFRLPDGGREPRVAIIAAVKVDGVVITVAATHLQNHTATAARQLEVLCRRLSVRPGPTLLMGDLNLTERRVLPVFERFGLVAAESGPTFPTRNPTERIDWIAGRGILLESANVRSVWSSDHFPLTSVGFVASH
jgi:endonuclease/exonuclease/phosphatase family metal-dependent hydrolase